jgi:hypothetical protein
MNATTADQPDTLVRVYLKVMTRDDQGGGYREIQHLNGGLTHAEVNSLLARPVRKKRASRVAGVFAGLAAVAVAASAVMSFASKSAAQPSSTPILIPAFIALAAAAVAFISHSIAKKEERRANAAAAAAAQPFMAKLHALDRHFTPVDLLQLADQLHQQRNESASLQVTPAITSAHTQALIALGKLAQLKHPEANIQGRQAAAATHLHHIPEVKAAADAFEQSAADRTAALHAAQGCINQVGKLIADEKVIAASRQSNT